MELFETARRLATDETFRAEFLAAPRKYLSDLGVSPEVVEKMVPAVLTILTTGSVLLNELDPIVKRGISWR